MDTLNYLLTTLWAMVVIKTTLFWVYLLQLKEYRLNRLADYFRTAAGKRILYNPLVPIFSRSFRRPKFTKKAALLFLVALVLNGGLASITIAYLPALVFTVLFVTAISPIIFVLFTLGLIKPLDIFLRRRILNAAARKMTGLKNLMVIGVTGSYGKTSTKEFLSAILETKFKVIKTSGHLNVETGIANFILQRVDDSYDIFVCEMAGYQRGDISAISKIIKPKVAVLTGANEQHLALFGSMANLLSAEGGLELINALPSDGFAVMNGTNRYTRGIYETANGTKFLTSTKPDKSADMWVENIKVFPDHLEFKILSKKNSNGVQFHTNLLGAQNIENILLAAAVAEELGIKLEDMVEVVSKFKPMDKTMILSQLRSGINLVDSSYASNPEGVLAHLDYLKSWGTNPPPLKLRRARKIVIMPCLIELGSASRERHEEIGEKLASVADLAIITTSEHFPDILAGAKKMIGAEAGKKILLIEKVKRVVEEIKKIAAKNDVILLEGRSQENIINTIKNTL